jgi:hypothetical protein
VMKSFAEVRQRLVQLDERPGLGWALAHCAQSIEFAIDGYPSARAWVIRALIGPRVLRRFVAQGAMSHDVEAPIPGAPAIDPTLPLTEGRARLESAMARFSAFEGPLAPHFAYGPVDKASYEIVQSLHVANHLG